MNKENSMAGKVTYLMEDERESERLSRKVNATDWIHKYLICQIKDSYETVLDYGCGSGKITYELAMQMPKLKVIGVDINPKRFEYYNSIAPANLQFIEGNINSLSFEGNSIDFIYSRFVFEYLPYKESTMNEIKRVLKPGGKILIQDLDGQFQWYYPENEKLVEFFSKGLEILSKTGFDANVGRKLFYLARKANFQVQDYSCEPYHFYYGEIDGENYELWKLKLDIVKPKLIEAFGSLNITQNYIDSFLSYLKNGETFYYSLLFTLIGFKE